MIILAWDKLEFAIQMGHPIILITVVVIAIAIFIFLLVNIPVYADIPELAGAGPPASARKQGGARLRGGVE